MIIPYNNNTNNNNNNNYTNNNDNNKNHNANDHIKISIRIMKATCKHAWQVKMMYKMALESPAPHLSSQVKPQWVFITGGCSGRGVQWLGVVLYNKLVCNII